VPIEQSVVDPQPPKLLRLQHRFPRSSQVACAPPVHAIDGLLAAPDPGPVEPVATVAPLASLQVRVQYSQACCLNASDLSD